MKGSEASVDAEESGGKKKIVLLGLGLFLLCCLLLVAVIILVLIFTGSFASRETNTTEVKWQSKRGDNAKMRNRMLFPDQSKIQPKGKRVKLRFHTSGNMQHLDKKSLDEANDYCKQLERKLPVPKSDLEELQMIEDMKVYHEVAKCSYYAIGYKLDRNMRYVTLDQKNMWPPITKANTAAAELENRDCIQIETGPNAHFKIISSKPCKDITATEISTIIYYHRREAHCEQNNWNAGCLDIPFEKGTDNFIQILSRRMKAEGEKIIGAALIDREWIPRRLITRAYTLIREHWLFEVKYIMNYLDIYTQNLSPYQINVTIFQDPERDCIAVNSEKGYQIETVLCDEAGCPACEL